MAKKEVSIPKKKVQEYYQEYFRPLEFAKLIGLDDFNRREIAWVEYPKTDNPSEKKIFRRNARFDRIGDFKRFIAGKAPYKLYFGAVYEKPWKGTMSAETGVKWDHNCLHFDLDVNDSDLMRRAGICDCAKSKKKEERKKICPQCTEIVKEGTLFLEQTLDEDFHIKKSDAVEFFSGARGFHVHYPSYKHLLDYSTHHVIGSIEDMEKEMRRNLVDYLTMVKEVEEVIETKIVDGKKVDVTKIVASYGEHDGISKRFQKRMGETVYKWYFMKAPEKTFKKMKPRMSQFTIDFIKESFDRGEFMPGIMRQVVQRQLATKRQIDAMRKAVLTYRYPRYDGKTTYDVRKVMKIPLSLDCSTGYIVSRIKDVESFQLGDVDHVSNYVKLD